VRPAHRDLLISELVMKTYAQHSPSAITSQNIPGRTLRGIFEAALKVRRPPTSLEITEAALDGRFFVSNLSAGISQLREILQTRQVGDVVARVLPDKGRNVGYVIEIWNRERFEMILQRMMLPWIREICVDRPRAIEEKDGQLCMFART